MAAEIDCDRLFSAKPECSIPLFFSSTHKLYPERGLGKILETKKNFLMFQANEKLGMGCSCSIINDSAMI